MYLIRRVFKVKPGTARKAAEVIAKLGKAYEDAGQRSPTRVYISGGTVPGPANHVYMDWIAEKIESPYRPSNKQPPGIGEIFAPLREMQEDSWIEFYQLVKPASMEESR
jgi:hypothetical protein